MTKPLTERAEEMAALAEKSDRITGPRVSALIRELLAAQQWRPMRPR